MVRGNVRNRSARSGRHSLWIESSTGRTIWLVSLLKAHVIVNVILVGSIHSMPYKKTILQRSPLIWIHHRPMIVYIKHRNEKCFQIRPPHYQFGTCEKRTALLALICVPVIGGGVSEGIRSLLLFSSHQAWVSVIIQCFSGVNVFVHAICLI